MGAGEMPLDWRVRVGSAVGSGGSSVATTLPLDTSTLSSPVPKQTTPPLTLQASKQATLPPAAGYYAAGYRFVDSLTGQATPPVYLPVQQVALSLTSTDKQKKAA